MNDVNLTVLEQKVVNFLVSKTNGTVYWEELVQFAKDPQNVSRKTVLKWISEIKRKYLAANLSLPYNVIFSTMAQPLQVTNPTALPYAPLTIGGAVQQKLVQIRRTPDGNTIRVNPAAPTHPAHADFVLDRNTRRVRTKAGNFQLNENEWNVFKYIHENVDKMIPLSELRDEVVFPQYGSKLPARWFDSIMRIVNNLRRQIVGLNNRLLTVKGSETTYLFK
jgi:hypothetical protein